MLKRSSILTDLRLENGDWNEYLWKGLLRWVCPVISPQLGDPNLMQLI